VERREKGGRGGIWIAPERGLRQTYRSEFRETFYDPDIPNRSLDNSQFVMGNGNNGSLLLFLLSSLFDGSEVRRALWLAPVIPANLKRLL
jgi:hypothetical protein